MTGAGPAIRGGEPPSGRLGRLVWQLENLLLVVLLGAIVVLAGSQILLRNVGGAGVPWAEPATRVLVLWLALAGAVAATRGDGHLTVDALSRVLSPGWRRVVHITTDLFAAAVTALLAWHGGRLVLLERQDGFLAFASVPVWVCELAIPLAFGLMTLRFLTAALGRLRRAEGRS